MTNGLPSRILTMTINRDFKAVNDYLSVPENFPEWAAGLGAGIEKAESYYTMQTPQGMIEVHFTPKNPFGIADHSVKLPNGDQIYIPMRVIQNNDASDVMFTLFRQPSMNDVQFDNDTKLVRQDLQKLKEILEG